MVPVRVQEVLPPIADSRLDPRKLTDPLRTRLSDKNIVDFGQTLVGHIRIRLHGPRGKTYRIQHGEMLDAEGKLFTENLRTAAATDIYTKATDEPEVFEPLFTFHGFRYIRVNEAYEGVNPDDVQAVVLHTDMEETGHFACSDPLEQLPKVLSETPPKNDKRRAGTRPAPTPRCVRRGNPCGCPCRCRLRQNFWQSL